MATDARSAVSELSEVEAAKAALQENPPVESDEGDDSDEEFHDAAKPFTMPNGAGAAAEDEDDEDDDYDEVGTDAELNGSADSVAAVTVDADMEEPLRYIDATDPDVQPSEQKEVIKELMARTDDMSLGDTWYLVSVRWWKAWKDYVSWDFQSAFERQSPGSIDNKCLVSSGLSICKKGLFEHYDYALLSKEVWEKLAAWYGGGPELPRKVIQTGYNDNLVVEVRPLVVKVVKSGDATLEVNAMFSKADTVGMLKTAMCKKLGIEDESEARVWDYHARSRIKLLDDLDERLDDAQIIDDQFILIETKLADGSWPVVQQQPSSTSYYSNYGASSSSYYSRTSSSSYYSSEGTREKTDPGLTGLSNLGNTCFMASSLQCLSNTAPFADFFLSKEYEPEINKDNPLGTGGDLAVEYAALLKKLWSGEYRSLYPRSFKTKRHAPQFAGYQQHDSQELLGFLLDGLHEDLNRVKDKPYTQTVEGSGRPDEVVAAEAWDVHKLRNNSVVVDWFQGQLKSTLVCPDCDRISVTFDPFMYLSLPLPVKTTREIEIKFFFDDAKRLPLRMKVIVQKSARIAALKAAVAEIVGIKASAIGIVDVYSGRFFKRFHDSEGVGDIQERDDIHAYELVLPEPPPRPPRTADAESATSGATDDAANSDEVAEASTGTTDGDGSDDTDATATSHTANSGERENTNGSADPDDETDTWHDTPDPDFEEDDASHGLVNVEDEHQLPFDHPDAIVHCQVVQRRQETARSYSIYGTGGTYIRKTLFGVPRTISVNPNVTYAQLYDLCLKKFARYIDLARYENDVAMHKAHVAEKASKLREGCDRRSALYDKYNDEGNSHDAADSHDELEQGDSEQSDSTVRDSQDTATELGESCESVSAQAGDDMDTEEGDEQANISADESAGDDGGSGPGERSGEEEDEDEDDDEEDDEELDYSLFSIRLVDAYGMTDSRILTDDDTPLNLRPRQTIALCWDAENWERYYVEDAENEFEDHASMAEGAQADDEGALDLLDCVKLFTTQEKLGPDDPWYCSACKDFRQATKKIDIWRLPNILVVHLKRFSYEDRYFRDKLDTEVAYPLEGLDLSEYEQCTKDDAIYDLYAVSNHFGGAGGGHYTAFGKNRNNGKWYEFDDSRVQETSESDVCSSSGYVLFYRRRSPEVDEAWTVLETSAAENGEEDAGGEDGGASGGHDGMDVDERSAHDSAGEVGHSDHSDDDVSADVFNTVDNGPTDRTGGVGGVDEFEMVDLRG